VFLLYFAKLDLFLTKEVSRTFTSTRHSRKNRFTLCCSNYY